MKNLNDIMSSNIWEHVKAKRFGTKEDAIKRLEEAPHLKTWSMFGADFPAVKSAAKKAVLKNEDAVTQWLENAKNPEDLYILERTKDLGGIVYSRAEESETDFILITLSKSGGEYPFSIDVRPFQVIGKEEGDEAH